MIQSLLIIIFIFLSVLIVTGTVIWSLIKWNNKKSRDTGCLIAILFFILALLSGGYLIYKGVNTVIKKAPEIRDQAIEVLSESLSIHFNDTPYMDSLRIMQPIDSIIPETFFTYGGFRDSYRIPLVYPYSMVMIDEMKYGSLKDESGISNIATEVNNSKVIISGITSFAFDKNHLLAKTEGKTSKEIKYILFDFNSKQIEMFDSQIDLLQKAKESGFDISNTMDNPRTYYYNLF
ncbi:hypothetical protein JGH11_00865 [Dysgonomonas sp. Marseille-P4677]|uniref:hypothetical protein n=1 Tax=Dysgonomonas sp. Marseille-P4677 TaxID=2364790 RepID=UPI0019141411|nr:hypothetical protein [Dysgonomonas sp. Marseille-P4677]MBK5719411.1 hypothetical protein [Dysgonomonas sp. Marseille-P4677]